MMFMDLKGKTLESAAIVNGELRLIVDGKAVRFLSVGDCCSNGWIANAALPPLPATIIDADPGDYWSRSTSDDDDPKIIAMRALREYSDVLKMWPSTIKTDKGDLTFEVWNDSNGYYGSSLEVVGAESL